METKKTDRRVLRTRNAIRNAFLHLLETTDYSKITITALAREADIDRKTFYTHYSSTADVLNDLVTQQVEEGLKGLNFRDFFEDTPGYTKKLLYAWQNSLSPSVDQKKSIVHNIPLDELLQCWTSATKKHIFAQFEPRTPEMKARIEVLLNFYLGGVFNTIVTWLKSDASISLETAMEIAAEGAAEGLSGLMKRHIQLT